MKDLHSRQSIVNSVVNSLAGDDAVRALWQAGSAANGRSDDWSDIDFIAVVRDDDVGDVFQRLETFLERNFGVDLCWRVPEPTWHGHSQRFYRLQDAAPYHLLDIVLQKQSANERFLETTRHGTPIVYVDRDGIVVPKDLDPQQWQHKLSARFKELTVTFPLFQPFVLKELRRGRRIDAYGFYYNLTLRPLVEILRIRYCPERFDFGLRYLTSDLPLEIAEQIESLVYVGNAGELENKQAAAVALFNKHVNETNG